MCPGDVRSNRVLDLQLPNLYLFFKILSCSLSVMGPATVVVPCVWFYRKIQNGYSRSISSLTWDDIFHLSGSSLGQLLDLRTSTKTVLRQASNVNKVLSVQPQILFGTVCPEQHIDVSQLRNSLLGFLVLQQSRTWYTADRTELMT